MQSYAGAADLLPRGNTGVRGLRGARALSAALAEAISLRWRELLGLWRVLARREVIQQVLEVAEEIDG